MFEWNNIKEKFYFLYSFAIFEYIIKKELYFMFKKINFLFF